MESDRVFVVGLTGGIGSGKSSVCAAFSRLGVPIIDTDEIAHRLSRPSSEVNKQIYEIFGSNSLLADGSLNRAWLRELVFTEPTKRVQLEAIFHPLILQKTKEKICSMGRAHRYCILAVPLLFETPAFHRLTNYSIVVDCDEEEQIRRVIRRSKLSRHEVQNIITAQMPRNQRNVLADQIIMNNESLASIDEKVSQIHNFLLEKT
jgi:dephospho-CoA kinase